MPRSRKKVAVMLTPLQIAVAEEAVGQYITYGEPPGHSRRSAETAERVLHEAFEKTGEPWPL